MQVAHGRLLSPSDGLLQPPRAYNASRCSCVAGLAIAAHLLDATCMRQLCFSLDSLSLILMSGFITTAHRQVSDDAPVLFIPICLNQ